MTDATDRSGVEPEPDDDGSWEAREALETAWEIIDAQIAIERDD